MDIHWGSISVSDIPQVWGQESVVSLQSVEGSSQEVLSGSSLSSRGSVTILNTGEVEEFLRNWGSDDTYTFRGWYQSNADRSALSGHFTWNGMYISDLVSPVSSSDWDKVELGILKSVLDGNLYLLSDLNTESDVSVSVSDSDDGLESSSLTGSSLLLDRHDFHDFVTEILYEVIDNLVLLNWEGVSVDFFQRFDMSSLH